jgi:hypothetical protein
MLPAASDAASTFDSSSGGRLVASTSGVAWRSTSAGPKICWVNPDSIIVANQRCRASMDIR